ncbi:MAG: FAD-dependent oxidoreductase [Deltaproteobacteria bacterium]|nr:FAD-dependent oxidoreductase [Deltaproteobacteria bacterium]
MPKDGGVSSSLWIDADVPAYDSAPESETDVCVIGAGIAGLTVAFELARRGVRVSVLDDGPIGGGETGRTTAHLASAVDDHYYELEQKFGEGGAKIVAESHSVAIDYIEAMVRELSIECEFERVDGYLIEPPGHHPDQRRVLDRELVAAQRAGLECEMVSSGPLPFDTGPALRFANQAQFHPMKYLRGLAAGVVELGGKIHTGVHVQSVDKGQPLTIGLKTRLGDGRMLARVAIDCSNGAFTSQLNLPLRQAPYRTYVLAFAIPTGSIPRALVWDTGDPYHYIRIARGAQGGDVLVVGGNDHRVGQGTPEEQWGDLEKWTRQWIPQVGQVVARWSGQVIEPADYLAHIGRSPDMEHVYVVTGDSGNGMTHGTIAGLMIPEMLHGKHPRWERVYDPKRSHLHAAGTLLKEATQSSAPYVDWLRPGDVKSVDEIRPGEGATMRHGLHLIAAYKDANGECHMRSATCTHLRGVVRWNTAEKTWDCPCHGSRFDCYGRVLNGPAPSDLMPLEAPAHDRSPEPVDKRRKVRDEDEVATDAPALIPVLPMEREP